MTDNEAGKRSPVVLVVEDDAAHAELVTRCFTDHWDASQIRYVSDGAAALDYVFRRGVYEDAIRSPRPDLILLDLRLLKVDGLEVARHVKSNDELKSIPIIMLTTSAAESDVTAAYDRHINSYVVKPTDYAGFRHLMDEIGLYWLGRNEYPTQPGADQTERSRGG